MILRHIHISLVHCPELYSIVSWKLSLHLIVSCKESRFHWEGLEPARYVWHLRKWVKKGQCLAHGGPGVQVEVSWRFVRW